MLVAIEGIDGSAKGTQAGLLERRAAAEGLSTAVFSFPRYGTNPFAQAVSAYLNGAYGSAEAVSPYLSALLYAGDRFCARDELLAACRTADLVICDRYVDSNVAHQGAKCPAAGRPAFISWIEEIEYLRYRLPRAELTILLEMPTDMARELIARKARRDYTDLAADIHEADRRHLEESAAVYALLAERSPDSVYRLQSVVEGGLRPPGDIAEEIWRVVGERRTALSGP